MDSLHRHAILLSLIVAVTLPGASSIGCFVCSSFNGSNPQCEDPFNSTIPPDRATQKEVNSSSYKSPCWAYKKGRAGLFPADHCIKINGVGDQQGMIIRTCALDSGSLTADTEIVRISHCGHFKFEKNHYAGCVQACDTDGCNSSILPFSFFTSLFFLYQSITVLI